MPKTFTIREAATELAIHISRVNLLCHTGRLGYTLPKHGKAWVITEAEIEAYRSIGNRAPGRPRKNRE